MSAAQELVAADVTPDASVVKGTTEISADAQAGKWDVVIETSDGKTAKLAAAGFSVTATSGTEAGGD